MSLLNRAENALTRHFEQVSSASAPPRLVRAMHHAVFPGGARVRPQLTIAVAIACGDDARELTNCAASAIELMHCASLVHDDMPAFDDADVRRGKPTVHKLFGEPLALLSGDALIVMAYQVMLQAGAEHPQRLLALMRNLSEGVGLPNGIVAGQAWECEVKADLAQYQRAKTGALFVASTCAGAISAGAEQQPWIALGAHLGEAYQVADDIRDVLGHSEDLGKPSGQDVLHARPSAATEFGLSGAVTYFQSLIDSAVASIPACTCRDMLQQMVLSEAERMVPSATCSAYLSRARSVAKADSSLQ
jgi:geranylgeranyl diphosphate synthase type II